MTTPPPPPMAAGDTSKNSLGVWALVLGILSIVCCGFWAGIPAVILGNNSKKAEAEGFANNGNLGNIGMILGYIGIVIGLINIVLYATGVFTFDFTTS